MINNRFITFRKQYLKPFNRVQTNYLKTRFKIELPTNYSLQIIYIKYMYV